MIRTRPEAKVFENLRHPTSIGHMSVEDVCNVDILNIWNVFNWVKPSNGGQTARRGPVQVAEDPIVLSVRVDQPARDDTSNLTPLSLVGSDGRAHEIDILDDAEGFVLGQLKQAVEDSSSSQREACQTDGPDAQVSFHQNISQHRAG